MKKAGFIGSFVSVLLGAMTLVVTNIINTVMPKLGYMLFQTLSSGSYSPDDYTMNFAVANTIACLLIVCGLIFGAYCFIFQQRAKKE